MSWLDAPDGPCRSTCNQPDSDPELWRRVLDLLDEARDEGLPIVAQVAGRLVGLLACLRGSMHPLMFHPAWSEVALR